MGMGMGMDKVEGNVGKAKKLGALEVPSGRTLATLPHLTLLYLTIQLIT